jgi:hypothetical protein
MFFDASLATSSGKKINSGLVLLCQLPTSGAKYSKRGVNILFTTEVWARSIMGALPGRYSRYIEEYFRHTWGHADGVISRTADVHIQRLRKKLKGNVALRIRTIVGQGYVLEHAG